MTTRITVRGAAVLAGLTMLGAALVPATANAQTAANVCGMGLSTVTPGGDDKQLGVSATKPPSASAPFMGPKGLYPDGKARLAGAVGREPVVPGGVQVNGYLVLGTDMYAMGYTTDGTGTEVYPGSFGTTKIGGGWGVDYTYFEESTYTEGFTYSRYNTYALQDTGRLTRWTVDSKGWHNRQFTSALPTGIKTMTLISQKRTYDTFLANTAAGALYSVRVPTTGALTPVVKLIRSSGWQGFETLVAEKCGTQSTLLLGIDKDTKSGQLYAVSHANGTATVIQGLGKVTGTFDDQFYARQFLDTPEAGNLNGE
ncbi:hypothetical protein [Streptomyces sp. SID13031]|uniref:hypothetical protein n=1 Tax=Streptomyces sp. SID13031 TaxID=2706046 RepID=UPI0013CB23B0|nr:hypothetical protein [Streptomyces sp. SID13031]NEA34602.1 hypothetical protein [Streptomyces sp. SID13031]